MTTSLVVAIEPDREQAARLSGIVRGRLGAELVLAESVARALAALGDRLPDLILTPALLSTRDEAALSARLRDLGSAAAHVQTLTVPRIGGAVAESAGSGIFKKFRRAKPAAPAADGCEPDVFAQQVSAYLQRARAERASTIPPAIVETVVPQPIAEQVIDPVVEPPFEEPLASWFQAIEPEPIAVAALEPIAVPAPEPIALAEPQPIVDPLVPSEPQPSDEPPVFISEPILVTSEPFVEDLVAPPVAEEAVVAPRLVEAVVEALPVIEPVAAAPPVVEEYVVPPPIVEEIIAPVMAVEEFPSAIVEELVTPAVTIEQTIEPESLEEPIEPIAEPIAAAPATAAAVESEPPFRVDDIDLEFWIADEPDTAPVEATVIPPAQPEDDRFYIAAQDFTDIDMSSLLDGLVLPDDARPEAPVQEAPAATVAPEPEPEPAPAQAPVGSRRKLPARRHVPVHERVPEPNVPRRRGKAPIQDEWGLFDPEQCGFAALVAKLDAVTDDDDVKKPRGTSTRVISYN